MNLKKIQPIKFKKIQQKNQNKIMSKKNVKKNPNDEISNKTQHKSHQ